MRCKVDGCNKQLDETGWPVEYCDWQQGRCPNKKAKLSYEGHIFVGSLLVIVFLLSWLLT